MLKNIVIGLAILIVILAVIVAMRPNDFRVERSATFDAPIDKVFVQVNDLQKWNAWSPWAKLDLNAKNTFTGPQAGKDAQFSWSGNDKVGEGSMTIIESVPNKLVRFQLNFIKPFQATNTAEFTFTSEGNKTRLTWTMYGKNNFVGKAIGLIMNCDKMLGGYFEQGFNNLRNIVEK